MHDRASPRTCETADHEVKALKGSTTPSVMHLPAKPDTVSVGSVSLLATSVANKVILRLCVDHEQRCNNLNTPRRGNQSRKQTTEQTKWVDTPNEPSTDDMAVLTIGSSLPRPITVSLEINDKPFTMKVDTGAAVSIMLFSVFSANFPEQRLAPATVSLKMYTGETMKVERQVNVVVKYEGQPPDSDGG